MYQRTTKTYTGEDPTEGVAFLFCLLVVLDFELRCQIKLRQRYGNQPARERMPLSSTTVEYSFGINVRVN